MNALGLPGASIDGILGFTILARFRLEIDLTQDRMTWTRLAHEPRDPPVPKNAAGGRAAPPLGVQAMSTLGSFAKGLAFVLGKQPEEEQRGRGFLGLEWVERTLSGRTEVEISRVLDESPAKAGGLQSGDRILKINRKVVEGIKGARAALSGRNPAMRWPSWFAGGVARAVAKWSSTSPSGRDFSNGYQKNHYFELGTSKRAAAAGAGSDVAERLRLRSWLAGHVSARALAWHLIRRQRGRRRLPSRDKRHRRRMRTSPSRRLWCHSRCC